MTPSAPLILAAALLTASPWPALGATQWTTETTTNSHTHPHCFANNKPSCWVTYTTTHTIRRGYFGSQADATSACSSELDGSACQTNSGSSGIPMMEGGWKGTCPGGVNRYGLCVSELFRYVQAYYPTLVVEQDIERPDDCRAPSRRFGNPIDGLSGEKHERITFPRWSSLAPPLSLHYRSGRFARQTGASAVAANNIAGLPGASGAVGLGLAEGGLPSPFGPLWTHSLDAQVTMTAGRVRVTRIDGSGGMSFSGRTDGSWMLPPADQSDRLQRHGGGAYWLHRDPRLLRTSYFSNSGRLVQLVNADGTGRQWLTYSDADTPRTVAAGQERLLAVRDAVGRQLRFVYRQDAQGMATDLIDALVDDSGNQTRFTYDAANRLVGITWPDGTAQRLAYDAGLRWALTQRIDETGVAVGQWTWDASTGLVTSSSAADGINRHALSFAQPPRVIVTDTLDGAVLRRRYTWQAGTGARVTLPNGSVVAMQSALRHGHVQLTQRSQPAGAGCNASASAVVLDSNGNAVVRDDFAGGRTCHAYDTTRNLEIVRVEGADRRMNCAALLAANAVLPPGVRKITTRWHPHWPLREVVASPGRIDINVYNDRPDPVAGGPVVTCMPWIGGGTTPYDSQPAALCRTVQRATTDANGSKGLTATWDPGALPQEEHWTYLHHGQPLSHKGKRTDLADLTTWIYHPTTTSDARAGDLAAIRNALGQTTQFHRWTATGQLASYSDLNGIRSDLSYDSRQRLIGITEAAGTAWSRQTTQHWDARGLLLGIDWPAVAVGNAAGSAQNEGRRIRYQYDRAHRLTGAFSATGQGQSYRLDASGNVITHTTHHGNDVTRPPTVVQREFDALNRPWREWRNIHGIPRATERGYDAMGRLTSVQRPAVPAYGESQPTSEQRSYDSLGRLTRIDANGLATPWQLAVLRDAADAVTTVASAGGSRFEFSRDGLGQALSEVGPDSGLTQQRLDPAGNLISTTDARGVNSAHTYDALNRRTSTTRRGPGTHGMEVIRYTWDSNPGGPLPCTHGAGRVCRIDDVNGTRHFAYNPFGDLIELWTVELGQVHRQTFAWDAAGRLIGTEDAGGAVLLARDGDGHVRTVDATLGGRAMKLTALGEVRADGDAGMRQLGNGVLLIRRHDSSGALSSQTDNARTGQ